MISMLLTVTLLISLAACNAQTSEPADKSAETATQASNPAKNGVLSISSSPAGADVYIDGRRCTNCVTPCRLSLPAGNHDVELRIPGYEECKETVTVTPDAETEIDKLILPYLAPDAIVITVNTEEDETELFNNQAEISADALGETVSFRRAVYAVQNDTTGRPYRIEFADNVNEVSVRMHNVDIDRGNLTVNGDRNRDGVPDVSFSFCEGGEWGFFFLPMKNLVLCGLRVADGVCPIAIRPYDDSKAYDKHENTYVLGCEFINAGLLAFGGACKAYGTGADGYGQPGAIDYTNFNFCGNRLEGDINMFFAYSGDCDYSVADGIHYCANTLDHSSILTAQGADCNTWYIYGRDSEFGNGGVPGQFESSDHNIVRNVTISGNKGGGVVVGAGIFGNSENTCENYVIRDNLFTGAVHLRPAQIGDEGNIGNTLITSGNTLRNFLFIRNLISDAEDENALVWLELLAGQPCDPSTTLIAENNHIIDLRFIDNIYIGEKRLNAGLIENGIDYILENGEVFCEAMFERGDPDIPNYQKSNNTYKGLYFSGNQQVTSITDAPSRQIITPAFNSQY